jgi:hypothetical protein
VRVPEAPVFARSGSGERRLSRRSLGEGGPLSPCHVNAASFDSAPTRMDQFKGEATPPGECSGDFLSLGRFERAGKKSMLNSYLISIDLDLYNISRH